MFIISRNERNNKRNEENSYNDTSSCEVSLIEERDGNWKRKPSFFDILSKQALNRIYNCFQESFQPYPSFCKSFEIELTSNEQYQSCFLLQLS